MTEPASVETFSTLSGAASDPELPDPEADAELS